MGFGFGLGPCALGGLSEGAAVAATASRRTAAMASSGSSAPSLAICMDDDCALAVCGGFSGDGEMLCEDALR